MSRLSGGEAELLFWRRPAQATLEEISPETLRERLAAGEELQLVDVREPHEYAQGHIPGTRLIPLGQLQGRLDELDPSAPTVLICRSGNRSGMATRILNASGFRQALNMAGGMLAWRGPVTR